VRRRAERQEAHHHRAEPRCAPPSIELTPGLLRDGLNVLSVTATPYENDRERERAMKVPPAVLRVEAAPPPSRRRLFNGARTSLVQSREARADPTHRDRAGALARELT